MKGLEYVSKAECVLIRERSVNGILSVQLTNSSYYAFLISSSQVRKYTNFYSNFIGLLVQMFSVYGCFSRR
jgi:hypothetical protein